MKAGSKGLISISAMIIPRALGFLSQYPVFSRSVLKRPTSSTSARHQTPYTLNDSVCPPTDRDVLQSVVSKHIRTLDRYLSHKPIAGHTMEAFQQVARIADSTSYREGIILDSGCGTARSTLLLGSMYPNHLVIGVDRSLSRLNRNAMFRQTQNNINIGETADKLGEGSLVSDENVAVQSNIPGSPNVILVRAELSDFWRCCLDANWKPAKHFMLYPNPYPKKARLKSRWYAHPAFPLILQLGGDVVLRSNWEEFLNEFALSVEYANEVLDKDGLGNYAKQYVKGAALGPVSRLADGVPWTNFEKKYYDSGEPVFELELLVSQ